MLHVKLKPWILRLHVQLHFGLNSHISKIGSREKHLQEEWHNRPRYSHCLDLEGSQ